MYNYGAYQTNQEVLSKFIEEREIPDIYRTYDSYKNRPYGYIYCIENKINHMKYIGAVYDTYPGVQNPRQFAQLRRRASAYLYEYNSIMNQKSSAKKYQRPIVKALVEFGIENFVMYPIAETGKYNHQEMEKFFIDEYDTIKNGYNVTRAGSAINRIGKKLKAKDKRLKSEGMIAFNLNQRKMIVSESFTLFAEHMNTRRDNIKSAARRGRPYKGWFVFYINPDKRMYCLHHNVLGDGLSERERHSIKSKLFYKELYDNVDLFLKSNMQGEYFSDFEMLPTLEYKDEEDPK